jgi:hypothetical protein
MRSLLAIELMKLLFHKEKESLKLRLTARHTNTYFGEWNAKKLMELTLLATRRS